MVGSFKVITMPSVAPSDADKGGGILVFRYKDFVMPVQDGHPYVSPVKNCSLYVDPRGTWTLVYSLDRSQWRGDRKLVIRLERPDGRELDSPEGHFTLTCHIAHHASHGVFPAGLFELIGKAGFTVSGPAAVC